MIDGILSIVGLLGSISFFLDHSSSRNQVSSPSFQDQDFKFKTQEPSSRTKIKSKRGQRAQILPANLIMRSTDPPKVSRTPTSRRLQLEYHQISSPSHVYNAYTLNTPIPDRIPSKEGILSPEWTHAIPTFMGHPLSSESGKYIQKWIQYHAIQDPTGFCLNWDPTDPDDIKLLQEYVESNGSVVYLPFSTGKSLISLWNYIYVLIKRERPVDLKCNVLYFLRGDQWFNLTASDMKTTLINAGMEYHHPQIIHGTPLPNSTSPRSPAPMRSSIHLELTPCDSTSTTTL